MATGVEAALVQAEAALKSGNVNQWKAILNGLRQSAISPAMDTLIADSTSAASPDMQLDVMFRERAFWLFLSGHRHGDLRRLIRQYGRESSATFPTGAYRGGGEYGNSVSFPPFGESASYPGCDDTAG
jgi:starch-binding outer membrane protein, SusD/RagB family